ncbi:MAG: hypothetical protein IKN42_07805, partial [Elusimicrobia bacterium]|nr:hypothetical protein [Elusimicrobiota bacterium]
EVVEDDTVTSWINGTNTLKSDLEIVGGGNTLTATPGTGNTLEGIKTGNKKLTVKDVAEYSGFKNAITVAENGELIVSDVTFKGNSGEAVITNEGTTELSNVTISENSADIDVANSGTLNITGEGKTTTLEKGISGDGTTTVASGAKLVNGANSKINQKDIEISGTLTNNNGTTEGAIKATNKLEVKDTGKLTTNASVVSSTNGIVNAGVIEFIGGENNNNINGIGNVTINGTVANGSETNDNVSINQGSVTVASGKLENYGSIVTSGEGIEIANGATLTTHNLLDTTANGGKIANEGTLEISVIGDAQSKNIIDGSGTLLISNGRFDNDYDGTLGTIKQGNIVVNDGTTFTSSATAVTTTSGIANEGTVIFYDGTNKNEISGDGNLTINGTVTNEAKIEQTEVSINADKKLTTKADNVVANIVNAGTVTFTSGKNVNEITGESGRLEIAGEVENDNNITQKEVEVQSGELANNAGKTIKADSVKILAEGEIENAGTINATAIENSGELENTGTITGTANTITNKTGAEITNSGTISATTLSNEINATITNEAEKTITATTITNAGTVENAGAVTVTDLTNSGIITNEGTITSTNAITNSGTMTSNADKIVITGTSKEIANTGTYNVTGGTISYKVSGTNTNKGTINIRQNEVTVSSSITNSNINLGTTLKVKDDALLEETSTLTIENGALLITDNGVASDIAATLNIA